MSPAAESHRILIVDALPAARRRLREILEPHYEILGEASNGHEALLLAAQLRPDVIFMDHYMPSMGGIEATRLLRVTSPGIRVVLTSDEADSQTLRAAMVAGARDFLAKPFEPQEVLEALERLRSQDAAVEASSARAAAYAAGTWAFVSPGAGDGRTTLLLGMAGELRRRGHRVAVLDLNFPFGDVEFYLGLDQGHVGLEQLMANERWLEPPVLARHLRRHSTGLAVLSGPSNSGAAYEIDWSRFPALLEALERDFDYVLVDLPAGLPETSLPLLDRARFVFPVVSLTPSRLKNLKLFQGMLTALGYSNTKLRPLVTLSAHGSDLSWLERARIDVAQIFPCDDEALAESLRRGVPVTSLAKAGPLAQALGRFAASLLDMGLPREVSAPATEAAAAPTWSPLAALTALFSRGTRSSLAEGGRA